MTIDNLRDYPLLKGLTLDGTIYFNQDMGVAEAVLPPGGYASAHAPTIVSVTGWRPALCLVCRLL
ncbi:MAG TPA: hypothetical protein GXX75_09785 [Clostridiales bacterium]|nr:hypothetical protein [Clostridiales bacterium]